MWSYKDGYTLDKVVDQNKLDFVSYISADIRYLGDISRFRGVHVIRDPRDVVVSSYFSHKTSHSTGGWPELAEFRPLLNNLSKDDGMIENIKFTAKLPIDGWDINLFDNFMEWDYLLPNIMEVKFERLVQDPYTVLLEMFNFLEMLEFSDVNPSGLLKYVLRNRFPHRFSKITTIPAWQILFQGYVNRFSKLSGGRSKGSEDEASHYRKGLPGDWRNHFTDRHKDFFKKNYNELLIKLGYETDDNW
jgi:hypothetical protein